jgi:hypothetical protein
MTDKEIEFSNVPNEKYKKFFDKFTEIKTLDVAQWKPTHLLAYFCKKYKETYGVDYGWKFNNPAPSKCFEVWQIGVLSSKLSANPKILKDYIDWVYENIVPQAKRRLTSISFMTKEEVVINYKLNVLFAGQKGSDIDRSTPLPSNYQDVLKEIAGLSISTYGDLAFMSQVDPMPDNLRDALNKMSDSGFDKDVLRRIV